MKNKIKLHQYINKTGLLSLSLLLIFIILNFYEFHIYNKNFNNKIINIVALLKEKEPNITNQEIYDILNNKNNLSDNLFNNLGIDLQKESIVLENNTSFQFFLIINIIYLIFSLLVIFLTFMKYNHQKEKEINEIVQYLEKINNKNYTLNIDSNSEDELSILKNEIYKTTIMLKESASNSLENHLNLKKSLEDISHQLKTPLTSILIMLDDLIDDPDMAKETRLEFINEIRRELLNINFLVQNLLKLAKFDSNTIKFMQENNSLLEIINNSIKNVAVLCDLKNITIEVLNKEDIYINCDIKWQIEAITNILKNCIEHSYENQQIIINYEQNNVYTMLEIKDFGEGINKKDLNHIFERFYKGANSSFDSVGIGLALSKTIIEKDNGSIIVESNEKETKFIIKYFKH